MKDWFRKMKLTFGFLILTTAMLSQSAWEQKTDMLTARKELSDAATVLDGKIYVLGGRDDSGNITNVFERYDTAADSWEVLAPYPLSVWRTSLAALNGKIYAMGGYESLNPFPFSPTDKAYSYDPNTNSWNPIQDMLIERGSAASVVLDGKIHLIGGANNTALNSHHMYDPSGDNWSVMSEMIDNRSGLTAAAIEGKIYAVGGYFLSGGVVSLSSAEVYDPNSNNWNVIASMPYTKLGITSGVAGGKMYVFGNENSINVLQYNPLINVWEELVAMPENVNFSGAATHNDLIYVMGGGEVNLMNDGIDAVHCFNASILGIDDFSNLYDDIAIYPNPTTDDISIIRSEEYIVDKIQLYSPKGNMIFEQNSSEKIDLNGLKDGVYFLNLIIGGNVISKKIIKH